MADAKKQPTVPFKGREITDAAEILSARARNAMTPEQIEARVAAHNERYRVVAIDPDEVPERRAIIAEELTERICRKAGSPEAVQLVRTLARKPASVIAQVLNAFNTDGSLRNPFLKPKK